MFGADPIDTGFIGMAIRIEIADIFRIDAGAVDAGFITVALRIAGAMTCIGIYAGTGFANLMGTTVCVG